MSSGEVLGAALLAGLASSLGPCIAPRYLLLAAQVAAGTRAPGLAIFIVGCIGGYLIFAVGGAGIALLQVGSHVVYTILAAALVGCGITNLLSSPANRCTHGAPLHGIGTSPGASFLFGVSCSLVVSPCCAPIALALGLQAGQHDAAIAAATLLAFGIGHALPLGAFILAAASPRLRSLTLSSNAAATVSGTLLTAVGTLYAVLA